MLTATQKTRVLSALRRIHPEVVANEARSREQVALASAAVGMVSMLDILSEGLPTHAQIDQMLTDVEKLLGGVPFEEID
jgi:hypothetical protein